ncbi:retrotransposon protein, putative, ty1-copia subclass [Tanacetum coccineum]
MPPNQEHVQLVWPLWSDLRVIPNPWRILLTGQTSGDFCTFLLGRLNSTRLVAKGFTQTYGVDYEETFSPVADIRAIRILIAIAAFYDYEIWQMNVKTTFLNGHLSEESISSKLEERELRVSCYTDAGYLTDADDLKSQTGYVFVLNGGVVDWKSTKQSILQLHLRMLNISLLLMHRKWLYGESANSFLGVNCIEIVLHVSDILLSQKKYILELLQSAGLSNCNPVSSPMATSSSLSLDDNIAFSNPVKYRQVVGSLQYVTLSRPDIAFAVNKPFSFTDMLWKGNPDTSLEAFSDADWDGDSDDRRSMGGFAIYLGSHLISWTARKQCNEFYISSTES